MTALLISPNRSDIETHQQVELFPTFAYQDPLENAWRVSIAGFAFQPAEDGLRQRMFLRVLQRLLRAQGEQLRNSAVFQLRVQGFLAEPQRAKQIVVRIGGTSEQMLRKSRRNGHFRGTCLLASDEIERVPMCWSGAGQGTGTIRVEVILPDGDERRFAVHVQLVPRTGVSVISDIDDTIKVSEVAHRGRLLHNTFLNPFVAVPGMAELYQQWAAEGAAFHYVSSSPWQLYGPLSDLFNAANFPAGSFHLRSIRFRDPSVLRLFVSRKRNKSHVIRTIFRIFSGRRFVLVGDSGERDPEIYGAIARKFPRQIERILIRRVAGRRWTRQRCRRAFRDIPRDRWQTFRVPTQIRHVGASW